MEVAYSSNGEGVYVHWEWRIVPTGVTYSSNGVAYKSKGAKMAHTSNGPDIYSCYNFLSVLQHKVVSTSGGDI